MKPKAAVVKAKAEVRALSSFYRTKQETLGRRQWAHGIGVLLVSQNLCLKKWLSETHAAPDGSA